jgi:hypothetical protein
LEGEEAEVHRGAVREDNVKALQGLFDQQAAERTMFLRECQAPPSSRALLSPSQNVLSVNSQVVIFEGAGS